MGMHMHIHLRMHIYIHAHVCMPPVRMHAHANAHSHAHPHADAPAWCPRGPCATAPLLRRIGQRGRLQKTISGQHVHKGAGLKGRAGHVRGRAVRVHLPAPHPKAHRGVRAGEELHLLSAHMGDTARASDEQHC